MDVAPTLSDVAAAAGVSAATASRVLTGSARVTTSTRRRVHQAVDSLGYVRRRATYSLPSARSPHVIAAAICEPLHRALTLPFHLQVLGTVDHHLRSRGYAMVVAPTQSVAAVPPLVSGAYGGVLLIGTENDQPAAAALAASRVPVRCIGRPPDDLHLPFVDVDNQDGGRQAAEYLILKGRRRFGILAGPTPFPASQDRVRGFRSVVVSSGLPEPVVAHGDFGPASGAHGARWLLGRCPDVDAVFAVTDTMAVGAARALTDAGLRVPDDVALIGYDDSPVARHMTPALTTVRQPLTDLAVYAADYLLADMGGTGDALGSPILPVELIIRDSA